MVKNWNEQLVKKLVNHGAELSTIIKVARNLRCKNSNRSNKYYILLKDGHFYSIRAYIFIGKLGDMFAINMNGRKKNHILYYEQIEQTNIPELEKNGN